MPKLRLTDWLAPLTARRRHSLTGPNRLSRTILLASLVVLGLKGLLLYWSGTGPASLPELAHLLAQQLEWLLVAISAIALLIHHISDSSHHQWLAWLVIQIGRDRPDPSGRKQALEYLHRLGTDLSGVTVTQTDLEGLRLPRGQLQGANFQRSSLIDSQFYQADLRRAHLQGTALGGSCLEQANLADADLDTADLPLARLRQANLQNANLTAANLRLADLQQADLRGANCSKAWLLDVNLQGADLSNADLREARLWHANLAGANLEGVRYDGIDLKGIPADTFAAMAHPNQAGKNDYESHSSQCHDSPG